MADRQQWAETGLGAVVLAAAAGFLAYALSHVSGPGGGGYPLLARFGDVGALAPGADVRVAGVKVGTVSKIELDPKTYLAKAYLLIDPKVKLPVDSTVKITSNSLLGGQYLAIAPGGSLQDLKPGAEFENTQGAVDLFGLIGQVIRPGGGGQAGSSAGSAPAAPSGPGGQSKDPYPGGE